MGGTAAAAAALKCAEARGGDCGRAEAARCGELSEQALRVLGCCARDGEIINV